MPTENKQTAEDVLKTARWVLGDLIDMHEGLDLSEGETECSGTEEGPELCGRHECNEVGCLIWKLKKAKEALADIDTELAKTALSKAA